MLSDGESEGVREIERLGLRETLRDTELEGLWEAEGLSEILKLTLEEGD